METLARGTTEVRSITRYVQTTYQAIGASRIKRTRERGQRGFQKGRIGSRRMTLDDREDGP